MYTVLSFCRGALMAHSKVKNKVKTISVSLIRTLPQ